MGTDDLPNHRDHLSTQDSSDDTLSGGAPGGAAAGQIGPYRLLQLLGEGGMGEVWLGEQKTPIHRTVALKLIKAGMDTKAVVARFESERQALALMDHPSIARVYDAGSTAEGRPYFVMEYVPGLPITEYCDKHRLTMKERLELFTQVCDGVQHAHQKAIIHRDLKPSNVLVAEQNNKAVPKIIDFGLAKATAQRLTDKTMFTELGVMIGTPEYMSPEQADLSEQNIDTRTDVYSLGVILYELLVGVLPFEIKALRAAGLEAILRVIREEEPPKPSTKVRSMGETSNASAEKRREEPRSFARHLQGELDWITMKALEKDRVRRYGTPSELSADISRYLRNEPVVAGPATAGYRIQKYTARHRIALGAAAGLLLLLIGFAVTQAVELHRITLERDRATRERDRATRITDFMTGMFKVSDPSEARGNSITAREVLDKASKDIDTGLAKDPDIQSQMMNTMGTVYENLGLFNQAESLFRKAIGIESQSLGANDPVTLKTRDSLAFVIQNEGRLQEAEKMSRETMADLTRVLGPNDPTTLASRHKLSLILLYEGHFPEAEKLERETLTGFLRVRGPLDEDTLNSKHQLADTLAAQGQFDEAEKLIRESVAGLTQILGPDHPNTLNAKNDLVVTLYFAGQYAEAEKPARAVLADFTRILGPDHMSTLKAKNLLADVLMDEEHFSEAERLLRETIDARRGLLGAEHPNTLQSMNDLAVTLAKEGKYAEAESLERQTLEIRDRVIGPDNPDTAFSTYKLAAIVLHEGHRDEALRLLRQSMDRGLPSWITLGIDKDPDLKSLHGDPRFAALVAQAKQRAAAAQKPD